eukprot:gene7709-8547_t
MDAQVDRENVNFAKEKILINVGGIRHETYRATMKIIPDTRLAWIAENKSSNFEGYDPNKNEYFFDRHPGVFSQILNYYRTGKLHSPSDVCGPMFEEELQFWGIDEKQMEPCCWAKYTEHRDAQENLKVFEDSGIVTEEDQGINIPHFLAAQDESSPRLPKSRLKTCFDGFVNKFKPSYFDSDRWKILKRKGHILLEDHRSSLAAKIFTFASLVFIILSMCSVCFHSMLYYHQNSEVAKDFSLPVWILDVICFSWFILELFLRIFFFCPRRVQFFTSLSNWIDILAICTYIPHFTYEATTGGYSETIEILSSLRMLRFFRFFRLSSGLQVLKHTMVASSKEMLLLLLLLMIPVTIFATIVYFCERKVQNTKFKTIPESFWWAIVTMTTVGYGDMAPKTSWGKLFGAMCSSCSLLILALPVSIIGNNFSLFYSYAQARLKLPKKSHNALVGAANVLVAETSNSDPDLDSDSGMSNPGTDFNNLTTGSGSLITGKRYKRDRLSLYAGGVVRSGRRPLRSRSTGVTGISSDSDKEQRDSLTKTLNFTATTDTEPASDQNNADSDETKTEQSQNEADHTITSSEHSNGSVFSKPPVSGGKRRPRSGTKKIHPVITLHVAEDGNESTCSERGVDNTVFSKRPDVCENMVDILPVNRTPPLHELENFNNNALRGQLTLSKHQLQQSEVHQMQQFKPKTIRSSNLKSSSENNKNNQHNGITGTCTVNVDDLNNDNKFEETSVDFSNAEGDKVKNNAR